MTSDHGRWPFPWSNLMVQLSWSDFLKNQFTKPLGPSLIVNRMWTKRNDHAPNNECVDFFNICPKKAILKQLKFGHFCGLLLSSSPLSPKKHSLKIYYNNFSLPWTLVFSTRAPLLPLPLQTFRIMLVDNVGLKTCLLGTSNSMITPIFFPWCKLKWSWDELNGQSHIL